MVGRGGVEPPATEGISCKHGRSKGEVGDGKKVKRLKEEFQELDQDALMFGSLVWLI